MHGKEKLLNLLRQDRLSDFIKVANETGSGCSFVSIYRSFIHFNNNLRIDGLVTLFEKEYGNLTAPLTESEIFRFIRNNRGILGFDITSLLLSQITLDLFTQDENIYGIPKNDVKIHVIEDFNPFDNQDPMLLSFENLQTDGKHLMSTSDLGGLHTANLGSGINEAEYFLSKGYVITLAMQTSSVEEN